VVGDDRNPTGGSRMQRKHLVLLAGILMVANLGACPGITITIPNGTDIIIPGFSTVVVEVFNDTDLDVDPRIVFDDDTGFWAGAFPSEDLATGILLPGDLNRYNMDCDEVGSIASDEAEQFLGPDLVVAAESSRTLERDEDFECGDTIQFHFIGEADGFGVIVSVNGIVVD
jgi:hypothetical protein